VSGDSTITPVGPAPPAVGANAGPADQRPVASPHTTRPASGEDFGRQSLIKVENLHAQRQITPVEFRQVLINQQGVYRLHHLFALALNCLRDPQLDLPVVVAYV